jgi:hypothetical protein
MHYFFNQRYTYLINEKQGRVIYVEIHFRTKCIIKSRLLYDYLMKIIHSNLKGGEVINTQNQKKYGRLKGIGVIFMGFMGTGTCQHDNYSSLLHKKMFLVTDEPLRISWSKCYRAISHQIFSHVCFKSWHIF